MRVLWIICFLVSAILGYSEYQKSGDIGRRYSTSLISSGLRSASSLLKGYNSHMKRYPSNDEGLSVFLQRDAYDEQSAQRLGCHSPKTDENFPYVYLNNWLSTVKADEAGIFDSSGVPLVYENRSGIDPKAFKISPITIHVLNTPSVKKDVWFPVEIIEPDAKSAPQWYQKVDEQVYVYSLSALNIFLGYKKALGQRKDRIMFYLILSGIFLVFFGLSKWPQKGEDGKSRVLFLTGTQWVIVSGIIGVLAAIAVPSFRTCYRVVSWRPRFNPLRAGEYVELMEEFQAKGVLKPETVEKLKQAATEEALSAREERRRNALK